MTDLQTLDDGTIKVCIEEEGYRHCGFVSSHHLVDVKAQQLRHFIRGSQRQVPPESDLCNRFADLILFSGQAS